MSSDDLDLETAHGHLDAFLVDNEELEALSAKLAEFNLFSVLRIENAEIRHSNMLAWLLSPLESHGLGAVFLRRFLSRLLLEHRFDGVSLTAAQVELMSFGDVEVYRERHNIDILVRSQSGRWCLLIENKVGSRESAGQLERYWSAVEHEFPGHQMISILLTLEGDDPSEDGGKAGFVAHTHVQILELAEQVERQHGTRIPSDAHLLLRHYLATLRRLTMEDQELIELCKSIYRKHREAIRLINDYGAASEVQTAFEAVLNDIDTEFVLSARGRVYFLPRELGEVLPSVPMNGWGFLPRSVPISCWLILTRKRTTVQLSLEVGPLANANQRIALLKSAEEHGFKVRAEAFSEGAKLTRLITETHKLRKDEYGEPDQNVDYIEALARKLWAKFQPTIQTMVDVVKAACLEP